jgi:hypothetical protein
VRCAHTRSFYLPDPRVRQPHLYKTPGCNFTSSPYNTLQFMQWIANTRPTTATSIQEKHQRHNFDATRITIVTFPVFSL